MAALAQRSETPADGGAQAITAAKSKAKAASQFERLRAASDASQRGVKRGRSEMGAAGGEVVHAVTVTTVQPGFDPDAVRCLRCVRPICACALRWCFHTRSMASWYA